MKNINSSNTLLGKKVEIRLEPSNKEALQRNGAKLPSMPTLKGILVKRFYFLNWGYVVMLDQPLLLDKDGMQPEVKKKVSTYHLIAYLPSTDIYNGKDPLYLELTDKENRLEKVCMKTKNKEIKVTLRYTRNAEDVPNEIDKKDRFLKDNPAICGGGWIKLID